MDIGLVGRRCLSFASKFAFSRANCALPARTQRCPRTMAAQSASTWTGAGSQEDFMLQDECILTDEHDNIVGHSNKKTCHIFNPQQPNGILHRAFSVFLFNQEGKLLLQQRAKDKITFPSVWTNTCCSHPLYGQQPDEVDLPEAVADGTVMGVKAAAVRKLEHELGIPPQQLPITGFHFLTRLHYCAADTHTWGPNAAWGEHEMDYILFIQSPYLGKSHLCQANTYAWGPNAAWGEHEMDHILFIQSPYLGDSHLRQTNTYAWGPNAAWGEHEMKYILFIQAKVDLKANPEEVDAVKYVDPAELKQMMSPDSGLLWSPWFRIIAEKFLHPWWADLDGVLTEGKHRDLTSIHHLL
eukprot:gene12804-16063_t